MRSAETLAKSADNVFEAELLDHSEEDASITVCVSLAALHVRFRTESEAFLRIFFVADANIHVRHEGAHHFLRFLRTPQFMTVVEVATDGNTSLLCSDASLLNQHGRILAQRRCDATPMKPIGIGKDGVEVKFLGCRFAYAATSAVVDDFAGTQTTARLQIINAQAIAAANYIIRMNAETSKTVDGSLTYLMYRYFADKECFVAKVLQTDSHIRLAATIVDIEAIRLNKPAVSGSGKPKHYLANCDYFCHIYEYFCLIFAFSHAKVQLFIEIKNRERQLFFKKSVFLGEK